MPYLHQASPEAPIVKMSDRATRVEGVSYKPRWAWSDWYRGEFRKTYSKQGWTGKDEDGLRVTAPNEKKRDEERTALYHEWQHQR